MSSEPTIRSGAILGALEALRAAGMDADGLLGEVGLDAAAIASDPELAVPLRGFVALLELAAARMGAPRFGLRVGLAHRPAALGVLGYVLVHSPDLGAAVRNLQRFVGAHQQGAALTIEEAGDEVRIGYRLVDPTIQPRVQDAELTIGVGVALFRGLVGEGFHPRCVWLEHGAPADDAEHRELLGCPVRFSMPTNAVVVDAALLARPTRSPDPALLPILERHASRILEERARASSLAEQVRAAVAERLRDGLPSAEDIARPLGLSAATLRRRLEEEGTTFRAELDAARHGLALAYLDDPSLTISEVAFLLGYSDGTAFHRAFKRWTGETPRAHRQMAADSIGGDSITGGGT
ncbi:MAG: AraC family transcriptional regulator [Sandaracinaceae bacterium]|nr:AraC family transcriptional regulator [Sandaracinaceae bacterium]